MTTPRRQRAARFSAELRQQMKALVDAAAVRASQVAAAASQDASVDASFVEGFLEGVLSSARRGSVLGKAHLDACRARGESAAGLGISLAALLDLHLSGVSRLWQVIGAALPDGHPTALAAVAEVLFRAADDAAAALAGGYEEAQRRTIRREEALRREFVDDLLVGLADPVALEAQAARFGFNLAGMHLVAAARTHRPLADAGPVHARVEAQILTGLGGRDVIVATKEGMLVCVFPATAGDPAAELPRILDDSGEGPWRIGLGRPYAGPGGVIRSFEEAREALDLAVRLGLDRDVVPIASLLPYRLFARDRAALAEMVSAVLGPLREARGGPQPLVETIEAFLAESGNISATARRLQMSPRAVSYRLERIEALTGHSPHDPEQRFLLELAVRGRRLVGEGRPGTPG